MESLKLPENFSWCDFDITQDLDDLYRFLRDNYVCNGDFRLCYSKESLKWALTPPNYKKEWHVSIRSNLGKKPIVAFISAIPIDIIYAGDTINSITINFLCVHSKIRNCRLAPVLIKEITHRANSYGVYNAVYTSGTTLSSPISFANYYHRPLNVKKLIDNNFMNIKSNTSIKQNIKLYNVPSQTKNKLRRITESDFNEVNKKLNEYLSKFKFHQSFANKENFKHWFTCQNNVIECYVVENQTGEITDMISYYVVQTRIINENINSAYLFYYFSNDILTLFNDILIIAKNNNIDVFNCLDILDNNLFIKEAKFRNGTGELKYYLHNVNSTTINADNVGLAII